MIVVGWAVNVYFYLLPPSSIRSPSHNDTNAPCRCIDRFCLCFCCVKLLWPCNRGHQSPSCLRNDNDNVNLHVYYHPVTWCTAYCIRLKPPVVRMSGQTQHQDADLLTNAYERHIGIRRICGPQCTDRIAIDIGFVLNCSRCGCSRIIVSDSTISIKIALFMCFRVCMQQERISKSLIDKVESRFSSFCWTTHT